MNNIEKDLKKAVEQGIINLLDIQEFMQEIERKNILEKHEYTIWKGSNGSWYTYLPDPRKGRVLKKRKERSSLENMIVEYYKNNIISVKPKVSDLFKTWLDYKLRLKEIEKSTVDRYEYDYNRHIKGTRFEELAIDEVTEDDITDFLLDCLCEKQFTSKAFNNLKTLISGMFKFAKKKHYTDISISLVLSDLAVSKKTFIRQTKPDEKQLFLKEEIPSVLDYLKSNIDMLNLGILLTFYTGLRVGELSALKVSDVNFSKRTLSICRTEVRYKDDKGKNIKTVRDYPKTEAGIREVLLSDDACNVLKKVLMLRGNVKSDYLYVNIGEYRTEYKGERIKSNNYTSRLYKICKRLNIPKRSMHCIRKNYGTMLLNSGVDESFIKQQLGHTCIDITKSYYYYNDKCDMSRINEINNIGY